MNCTMIVMSPSPEMALRLEGWHGGRADVWVAQQAAYDLWQARQARSPKVKESVLDHVMTA